MNNFEAHLRQHDLRITKPRRAVFAALQKASKPLPLNDIVALCPGIDRSSIYRTIDTCIHVGAVKVVHLGWKKQYELTDLFSPHHHHFRCTVCKSLTHVSDTELEHAIEAVSRKHKFIPTAHHFEIEGICRNCQTT